MQNCIVFITGRKGCGKSTRAQRIMDAAHSEGQRIIAVDPLNCWQLPGAVIVREPGDLVAVTDDRDILVKPDRDETAAAAFLYAYVAGQCWLFVDEIDLYLSVYRDGDLNLSRIIRYGRHKGVNLVAISQRPANVQRDLTAQADFLICYNVTENRDLEYLARRVGSDLADDVQVLPMFKSVTYPKE